MQTGWQPNCQNEVVSAVVSDTSPLHYLVECEAIALRCGLRVAGTVGLLEAAAAHGLLDFAVSIQRLRQTSARLDDELIRAALTRNRSG